MAAYVSPLDLRAPGGLEVQVAWAKGLVVQCDAFVAPQQHLESVRVRAERLGDVPWYVVTEHVVSVSEPGDPILVRPASRAGPYPTDALVLEGTLVDGGSRLPWSHELRR